MKCLTVFTRFGTEKYRDSDIFLRSQLEKTLPGVSKDFIIVDTALPHGQLTTDERGIRVLGCENTHWEFGAFDFAVNHFFADEILRYDYVLLATSALHSGYIDFYDFLTEDVLRTYRGRAVALGHLEVYNHPVHFYENRFQAWLRSSFIVLPPSELKLMGKIYSVEDKDAIFSKDPSAPYRVDAPLCEQYRSYIHGWLTGEGTGQGVQWHSRFNLDESNFDYYKAKATAILNEMSISNRLLVQGTHLVDLTWVQSRINAGKDYKQIPDWHTQLVTRGTGHEFVVRG